MLMMSAISVYGFSQTTFTKKAPETTTQNLTRGVIGQVSSNSSWANFSVLNGVPGSSNIRLPAGARYYISDSQLEPRLTSATWVSTLRRAEA